LGKDYRNHIGRGCGDGGKKEADMRIRLVLGVAATLIGGATSFALAQQATSGQTPVITRGGGIAGTGLGAGAGAAGVQGATVGNPARSPAVVSGTAHIGAGTGGLGLGMGNAVGGVRANAIGVSTGGINDFADWGTRTGGVNGVGRGFGSGSGGINDTPAAGIGINTGGILGSAIGAGTGGLKDLNTLGASTGGANEGNNAPRYRVTQ
jgi:hypothetical protein